MRSTRHFMLGAVPIGGGAPVSVQSMTKCDTRDRERTLAQIEELAGAGCDIVRVAVPDREAAGALPTLAGQSPLPLVADVHFDYRLALAAIEAGVDGIRINPGNIGAAHKAREVARAAAANGTVVRVGVNAGSLERGLLEEHGGSTAEAMTQSALRHCDTVEREGCDRIKVSLKASDVTTTLQAYRRFAARTDYPLHLGVTEAGPPSVGIVKSSIAIGCLLLEGIGDTIRVSLTAPAVEEVLAGLRILQAIGLRRTMPEIVSCPTCGRTRVHVASMVRAVEAELGRLRERGYGCRLQKIAVMGCAVNGPGEAREADVGIAGGKKGAGVLFRRGEVVRTLPEEDLLPALLEELARNAFPLNSPGSASAEG